MKHLDVVHHKDKMFRNIFFNASISLLFSAKHNIFSLIIPLKGVKKQVSFAPHYELLNYGLSMILFIEPINN
jgi:hypothetical protein